MLTKLNEYQGLVISIVKQHHKPKHKIEFDDLVAEGNVGLYRAIQTYDPNKGVFSTYAFYWIRKYVQEAIEKNASLIYIPRYMKNLLALYHEIKSRLTNDLQRFPNVDEVIDEMNITDHERICVKKALQTIVWEMENES